MRPRQWIIVLCNAALLAPLCHGNCQAQDPATPQRLLLFRRLLHHEQTCEENTAM